MPSLKEYQDQYEQFFRTCQIVDPDKQRQVDAAIAAMEAHQARYAALAEKVGVTPGTSLPWCISGRLPGTSRGASGTATVCRPAAAGRKTPPR